MREAIIFCVILKVLLCPVELHQTYAEVLQCVFSWPTSDCVTSLSLKPFDFKRNESAMLLNRQRIFQKASACKANEIFFDFHGLLRNESSTDRNHAGLAQNSLKEDTRAPKELSFENRMKKRQVTC